MWAGKLTRDAGRGTAATATATVADPTNAAPRHPRATYRRVGVPTNHLLAEPPNRHSAAGRRDAA